jgi:hypothetical protein
MTHFVPTILHSTLNAKRTILTMITNIPLCLARAILCDWLEDMKSIVNLDSAICGKGRNTWLDILKDDFVVLRKLVIVHSTRVPIANLLEWI